MKEEIQTGPNGQKVGQNHEIMDIKKEFQQLNQTSRYTIDELNKMVEIEEAFELHSLAREKFRESLIDNYVTVINELLDNLQYQSINECTEKLEDILDELNKNCECAKQ